MIAGILEKIKAALTGNEAISAWCNDKYGKDLSVFIGQNFSKPIEKSSFPCVIFGGVERGLRTDQELDLRLIFGVAIENESFLDGVYQGAIDIEELRELVEVCLIQLNLFIQIEFTTVQSDIWPVFSSKIMCEIRKKNPLRGI